MLVSDGKPLRRLLVISKARAFLECLVAHDSILPSEFCEY